MAKATRKQALGRGLSALLKDPENDIQSASDQNADKVVGSIVELDLDSIAVNPFQPRSNFDDVSLKELADSIRQLGLIQPITVRKLGFDQYQLVSGERRYRASKQIGLKTIPAYIRIANDQESLEMALVENIQRQDLDPVEIALSYERLIDEIGLTQEKLSERVGKKRSTITNYLRLLRLDPIIQTGMRDGFISMGHGRSLVNVDSREDQISLYEQIIGENLSVRETEARVRGYHNTSGQSQKRGTTGKQEIPDFAAEGLEALKQYLETNAKLAISGDGKGKISIPFKSPADFKNLIKRITGA